MIVGILLGIVTGLLANELCEFGPWCARKLVRWSAFRRYTDTSRAKMRAEELESVINERPGNIFKLITAVSFAVGAVIVCVRRTVAPGSDVSSSSNRPLPSPERDEVMERVGQLIESLAGAIDERSGAVLDPLIESWTGAWIAAVEADYLDHCEQISTRRAQARHCLTKSARIAEHEREVLAIIRADYAAVQSEEPSIRRLFVFRRLRKQYRKQAFRTAKAEANLDWAEAVLKRNEVDLLREDGHRTAAITSRKALASEAANYARLLMASKMRGPA
jgi:hypothetical protein